MYHASHVEGLTVVCKEGEGPKVNGERLDEVLVWDIMTCDEPWAPVEVRILIYIYTYADLPFSNVAYARLSRDDN